MEEGPDLLQKPHEYRGWWYCQTIMADEAPLTPSKRLDKTGKTLSIAALPLAFLYLL